ncbi:MAG: hypothetical protein KAH22_00250 [Thiotrichaceae bacterium]|nr:hypothetical protein [Thiotrichaceae bacterium]
MNPLALTQLKNAASRRNFLLLPLAAIISQVIPTSALALDSITPPSKTIDPGCPLNSGGPTLLNSSWRVGTIYGNRIPYAIKIIMKINSGSLTGNSGCNKYTAVFKRVGYTGFRVVNIQRGKQGCKVVRPVEGGPTINVGDLEGGFLRTLRRMGSVQQFKNKLVFYNRSGERAIILTKNT